MLEFFLTRSPFRLSNLARRKPGLIDTDKIVGDFLELFPENSFESLSVPLFVTATDIVNASQVIFDSGPLIPAILASSAFPAVFTPVQIGERFFMDGGIVNNFPVDLLEGRCDRLLGVYASPPRRVAREDLGSSLAVLQRALEVGIFTHSRSKFDRCDVVICPEELGRFGVFDTKQLKEIEEVGYRAARAELPAIRRMLSGLEVEQG